MGRKRWSILKGSEHKQCESTQGEVIGAQVDEILGFEIVLWKPADSSGKAFRALANWISCVFSVNAKEFISCRLKSSNSSGHRGEEALFFC